MKRKTKRLLCGVCTCLLLLVSCFCVACMNTTTSSSEEFPRDHTVTFIVNGEHYKTTWHTKGVVFPYYVEPEIENYTFDGWYFDEAFTNEATKDDVIDKNLVVYAKMLRHNVVTSISLDDLFLTQTEICKDGERPWAYTKSKFIAGYELVGAYLDEECTTLYEGAPANGEDFTIYYRHKIIKYTITYNMPNSNPTTYTVNDEFTLVPPQHGEYEKIFEAWQTPGGRKYTEIKKGSTGNLKLSAAWADYLRVGNDFLCGYYPQTIKDDDVTVERYKNTKYYLGSDGYYYLKKTSSNTASGTFSNGTEILPNTTYYFRMQPIVWNVYNEKDGTLHLASKYILDGNELGNVSYNNNTTLRPWLNQTFAASQFTQEQYDCMTETTIETGSLWLKFETTNLIHIAPSFWVSGASENAFGGKIKIATDYARLSGIMLYEAGNDANDCYADWWVMTTDHSGDVKYVGANGSIYTCESGSYYDNHSILGIVPFMYFTPENE